MMSTQKISATMRRSEVRRVITRRSWSRDAYRSYSGRNFSGFYQDSENLWREIPISYIRMVIIAVGAVLTVLVGMLAPWCAEVINRLLM